MSPVVASGLFAITERTNLAMGLLHPNDFNAAKEMLLLLHRAGESLVESHRLSPFSNSLLRLKRQQGELTPHTALPTRARAWPARLASAVHRIQGAFTPQPVCYPLLLSGSTVGSAESALTHDVPHPEQPK